MLYRSQAWRLVHAGLRKRNHILWHLQLFSGRLPVKIVKTLNDRQSALLAESLRSGKRKAESGKRKEERGKRKEERGKRKEERGKRKEEKRQRKEEKEESRKRKEEAEKSSKGHKTWFRFLSPVNQTLNLRSIKSFTIACLFLIAFEQAWLLATPFLLWKGYRQQTGSINTKSHTWKHSLNGHKSARKPHRK